MKKFIAAICAMAMVLALPLGSAFAAESSEIATVSASGINNTTLTVTGTEEQLHGFDGCDLVVIPTDRLASNTPEGVSILASYEIYYNDRAHDAIIGGGTVVVNLGCEYAGYYFTCYVEHTDGTTEVVNGITDSEGNAAFDVSKLSWYTFVIGDKATTATDNSSVSPKTGFDFTVAGGIAAVALMGAGVAFAARRKLSE